ncbi:FAD-dependent monooxygenase [Amycolatopsis sp. Poz14]|uniref:FAD-dependent monooxygenase n=1 Tax=Amycolatopsis sp. Poz14 TaxID=1447705 RepID=UPI001EE943ED|nr:FAD-dependent monooxygenase [Amycolatopsis sp. Poz14]MCG3754463.1 FAD-dependent monooxygenase [Amycolatopsis sp. Poz14]
MPSFETDVLVVGAGPAGLTASALLAAQRVHAVTITKYPGTAHSPRAHITNQRTMEVFRDLGIEDAVREVAVPNELMGDNVWATSFAGQELARLKTWGSGTARHADYAAASPSAMCNIPQHILEPVLRAGAERHGAYLRFSTELVRISQMADAVHAVVLNRETGAEQEIVARYAIGADGGRSTVADQLGFVFDGESGLGRAANVWLEADLTRYTAHRPGTLYWMCQPGNDYWVGSGTFICVKPWTEWVMLFMYDPAEGEPDLSPDAVRARASTIIGDPDVEVRIKAVSEWQINHLVARSYRRDRVFLAGDAAHRHPPANGLGTNTSVQDAFNLAWKLAAVVRGEAGEALLDTYDAERQPVGKQVVDRAMRSVEDMRPISQAFGFRPGQTSEEGWRSLDGLTADTPDGRARRAELRAAVELQNYQFNAHGVELGQRYASAAVASDGTPWPSPARDPELYYQATTQPGARLPHAWLEHAGTPVSTMDITGHGQFTVLTGIGGQDWLEAAAKLATEFGIELASRQIGLGCEYTDPLGDWERVREISERGCLLVRPDHHVAWRSADLADDPLGTLRDVLRQVLAR